MCYREGRGNLHVFGSSVTEGTASKSRNASRRRKSSRSVKERCCTGVEERQRDGKKCCWESVEPRVEEPTDSDAITFIFDVKHLKETNTFETVYKPSWELRLRRR